MEIVGVLAVAIMLMVIGIFIGNVNGQITIRNDMFECVAVAQNLERCYEHVILQKSMKE
jgi:hypothetical protein